MRFLKNIGTLVAPALAGAAIAIYFYHLNGENHAKKVEDWATSPLIHDEKGVLRFQEDIDDTTARGLDLIRYESHNGYIRIRKN